MVLFIFRGFGRLILDNKTVSIQNKDFLKVFTSYINIPGLDDTANYSALIVGIVVAVYVIFSVVRSRANKAKEDIVRIQHFLITAKLLSSQ